MRRIVYLISSRVSQQPDCNGSNLPPVSNVGMERCSMSDRVESAQLFGRIGRMSAWQSRSQAWICYSWLVRQSVPPAWRIEVIYSRKLFQKESGRVVGYLVFWLAEHHSLLQVGETDMQTGWAWSTTRREGGSHEWAFVITILPEGQIDQQEHGRSSCKYGGFGKSHQASLIHCVRESGKERLKSQQTKVLKQSERANTCTSHDFLPKLTVVGSIYPTLKRAFVGSSEGDERLFDWSAHGEGSLKRRSSWEMSTERHWTVWWWWWRCS